MKSFTWLAVLAAALACSCASPQDQVRKTIQEMIHAVENKDIRALDRYIGFDYADAFEQGRSFLLGSIAEKFPIYKTIDLEISNLKIEIAKDKRSARATFDVRADLDRQREPLGKEWFLFAISLHLRKYPEGWQASWADGTLKEGRPAVPTTASPQPQQDAQD